MIRHTVLLRAFALVLAGAPCAIAQPMSQDAARAPGGTYQLETSHSQILFSVLHLGLTNYYGRFDKLAGAMNFDPAQPERSSVNVTIDTTSIDTPSARLAETLRGEVFDIAQFPSATFKSTSVVRTGPTTGRMTGDLTIRNITRPVVLDVTFNGGGRSPVSSGYALGFRAVGTVRRSDYGMTNMIWSSMVSDDVRLVIEAMFQQEKD